MFFFFFVQQSQVLRTERTKLKTINKTVALPVVKVLALISFVRSAIKGRDSSLPVKVGHKSHVISYVFQQGCIIVKFKLIANNCMALAKSVMLESRMSSVNHCALRRLLVWAINSSANLESYFLISERR